MSALLAVCAARADAADALAGTLTGVGSDTVSALVARWAEAFRAVHPRVRVQVQASGSASAPTALIEGAADFGSMSRPMNETEIAAFQARHGHAPTQVVIAHDAIAVFVHPDNPLTHITLPQLDAIYSAARRCGAPSPVRAWRDLGLDEAPLAASRVLASGRNDASGTYEMFREGALCGGDYRADVVAWPGNGAVVATVATNREAIGYAGLGYVNGLVKPLALARSDADAAVLPDRAAVTQGRYPLSRALYLYVNRTASGRVADLPAAFLAYALSDAGQALAQREGFMPLQAHERDAQRALLE
ncbi:PstS family phosphate ABC transporter substrate-binding protein [Dokdonella sp.]|uniref:PstS family phosphate ABC transporter substrate-binding protein n=1 Tax=Dokdonella sp. TaxID=2291710 RepID=UPI001B115ABB|nr:PstS family phosphate ABC transporter substrate-binding protein [Dokdonella sp.]MBO9662363.1 PstS family phosphate ABC transporter substrate-binding protein [Dokdonella sp.]